ncbi:MAG: flagellar biosynthesis protein FlgM [Sulfurimonas sp. RIFOXYD12_FULL_33_39]|uniref:flagellar biosynthesis anti-sigma factor FlgM n=1 Tax=unclassified Sulfurimonas TaxID=2623549 RepID=UPI0008B0E2E9|nr:MULTISPECIES: flagellar biosynthesis anti-sigma factor FlgM [unclassified Sulfurimonas]OHE01638.1 MAG: flagellar biosynthesis protein FlgM [Sulfurimonas sp. RIFCSPLOWO2_12_FULL_34_6]OHE10606.1 MAG: flagellar biosynthesis protein FlgM [Sulfurimonas sp. RIFOXYD12_FULL_33_39]OHE15065.1 MAG: flagellar biosynthesis protein FlgM [Sulfurimonas sp. RIFOXYD2_FULL_34_21]DAB27418.1 MAG TPA: flagellar biosynthesis protein FlgM [Sulfurimonas sp. UBA10385]
MISQVKSAALRGAYAGNVGESKETSQKEKSGISKQGDTSKVEQIKEALESGQYKVNLQALSEKIAQELM